MDTKKCYKCGEVKLLADFYRDKRTKSGYRSRCKVCIRRQVKSYADRVQNTLYQQKYYRDHKEYYAKWREDHRVEYRAARRADYHLKKAQSKLISATFS